MAAPFATARRSHYRSIAPDATEGPEGCTKAPHGCGSPSGPSEQKQAFDLPPQLLEAVLKRLGRPRGKGASQDVFRACSVCRAWRAAAHAVFFSDPWAAAGAGLAIQHPAQLFSLCPPQHNGRRGHIQCYMRRELLGASSLASPSYRFVLYQGADYALSSHSGRFMLAALQDGSHGGYALFLNRACTGRPVARLSANVMRTNYTLTAVGSSGSDSGSSTGRAVSRLAGGMRRISSAGSLKQAALCVGGGGSSSCEEGEQQQQQHQQHQQHQQAYWPEVPPATSLVQPLQRAHGKQAEQQQAAGGRELLRVAYKLRVRGMMLPRRMAVTLPAPQQQQLPGAVSQLALARTTSDAGLPAAAAAAAAAAGLAEMEDDVAQQAGSDQAPRSSSSSAVADAAKRQLSLLGASSSGLVPCKAPGGCPHGLAGRLQAQQAGQEQQAGPATHMLQNKPPHWNEGLRCWCLNFRGRVRLASVKNFQLMCAPPPSASGGDAAGPWGAPGGPPTPRASLDGADGGAAVELVAGGGAEQQQAQQAQQAQPQQPAQRGGGVVLQFGKVDANCFILDYDPAVVSGLHAFAVALTTFGTPLRNLF